MEYWSKDSEPGRKESPGIHAEYEEKILWGEDSGEHCSH